MSNQAEHCNLELPQPAAPAATYVPYRIHNNVVYISGQLPMWNGELKYVGKVGQDYDISQAQDAARLCALNIIAQLKHACNGDLDRVDACLRLGGFVNCVDNFKDQPKVINGASEVMIQVFGDRGLHARAAVGVNTLPLGVAVEVDAMFALKA
jgi:enamine deaminase RidA (YjgF/YER057c/UK114 family)